MTKFNMTSTRFTSYAIDGAGLVEKKIKFSVDKETEMINKTIEEFNKQYTNDLQNKYLKEAKNTVSNQGNNIKKQIKKNLDDSILEFKKELNRKVIQRLKKISAPGNDWTIRRNENNPGRISNLWDYLRIRYPDTYKNNTRYIIIRKKIRLILRNEKINKISKNIVSRRIERIIKNKEKKLKDKIYKEIKNKNRAIIISENYINEQLNERNDELKKNNIDRKVFINASLKKIESYLEKIKFSQNSRIF